MPAVSFLAKVFCLLLFSNVCSVVELFLCVADYLGIFVMEEKEMIEALHASDPLVNPIIAV